MTLAPLQILAVVVLVYFTPAAAASGWLCCKLGIGKQWGWLALLVIGLLRITSSVLRLVASDDEDTGVSRAARYIPSIGTVALLLAMLELLDRLRRGTPNIGTLFSKAWSFLYYLQLATFVLTIVGPSLSSDPVTQTAACLIAAIFVIQVGCGLFFLVQRKRLSNIDRKITVITQTMTPFLAVRIIYAVLASFAPRGTAFEGREPGVYVQAFMQYLMEFVVVPFYLVAGNMMQRMNGRANNEKDTEY